MAHPHRSSLIHVALVEDDVHFKNAFIPAIEASLEMRLVCVASTRAEGLRMLELAPADVLLVDLGLPDGSGIDVIRAAAVSWPDCGVMVSTIFGDEAHVMQSIEAGASGYLLKDSAPENMMDEIRSLSRGGSPISPLIARQILMRFRQGGSAAPAQAAHARRAPEPEPASGAALSVREQEVLELITKGFTYDEVANLMQVSRYTVMTFVRRIYAKLKVKSKTEAIYEARSQGLL
jgi:DNA-binding NarL/FixJ family response regulator